MKFNDYFKEIPILETERLVIRAFKYDDIEEYLSFFSDEKVQKYLGSIPIPKDTSNAKRWIDNMNGRCLKTKLVFTWCIDIKGEKEVVGRIDLGGFIRKSMADIAFYLSKEYWNKGIMTEAVNRVVDFGFRNLKLHRIQAAVLPQNIYSIKLLEKVGFVKEGLLRKYDFGREFKDTLMFSMLNEDYSSFNFEEI